MYNMTRRFGLGSDEFLSCEILDSAGASSCPVPYVCCETGIGRKCMYPDECNLFHDYCAAEGREFEICGGSAPGPTTPVEPMPIPGGGGGGGGATHPAQPLPVQPTQPAQPAPAPSTSPGKILGMTPLVAAAVGAAVLITAAVVISK